jgi:hypothetical protein
MRSYAYTKCEYFLPHIPRMSNKCPAPTPTKSLLTILVARLNAKHAPNFSMPRFARRTAGATITVIGENFGIAGTHPIVRVGGHACTRTQFWVPPPHCHNNLTDTQLGETGMDRGGPCYPEESRDPFFKLSLESVNNQLSVQFFSY